MNNTSGYIVSYRLFASCLKTFVQQTIASNNALSIHHPTLAQLIFFTPDLQFSVWRVLPQDVTMVQSTTELDVTGLNNI